MGVGVEDDESLQIMAHMSRKDEIETIGTWKILGSRRRVAEVDRIRHFPAIWLQV